ncbi:MAG: ABC transporter permease [Kineosporiaceae bacterium]
MSARVTAAGATLGLVVPAAALAAWQAAAVIGAVAPSILPPPAEVLDAAGRLAADGSLAEHLSTSVVRVATGFAIGAGLALVAGIGVGLSRTLDRLLTPSLLAIRAVPSLAWVPLLVLWIGLGEQPKVVLVAIGAFFPVLATLVSGLRQVDPGLVEVARTYGLSPGQRVRSLLLPTAAPSLLAGARLGLAQAWLFLVAAELLGASAGLGFLLVDSQNTGRVEVILLTIVLLAVLGKLSDAALGLVEHRVVARLR